MRASDLVARLELARETGSGRWVARCPAHDDGDPSLSVRELEDGRTLVHCFAGCDVLAVVEAVGMTLTDLFPPRTSPDCRPQPRRGFHPMDVLRCVEHEARVVLVMARTLEVGEALSADDRERLALAVRRISAAADLTHGA